MFLTDLVSYDYCFDEDIHRRTQCGLFVGVFPSMASYSGYIIFVGNNSSSCYARSNLSW